MFVGGELTHTAMAVGGALLFSLFIIYDTQVSHSPPTSHHHPRQGLDFCPAPCTFVFLSVNFCQLLSTVHYLHNKKTET
jgi:hypothetical protein